jgi:hypothetical protein
VYTLNFNGLDFLNAPAPLIGEFDLRAGDVNGSNKVTTTDLGAVLNQFGQAGATPPDPE